MTNIDIADLEHTHEEFLSTYYKYSVFVPTAIESMFQHYLDTETTTSKPITINDNPTDSITVKSANQPDYLKMLLGEIKKLIELD